MRICTGLLLSLISFLAQPRAACQDMVYFTSGAKEGKTELLNQQNVVYTPPGKKASLVTASTKKLVLLFNKSGDFLAFERLDFSSASGKESLNRFLTVTTTRKKDQLYRLSGGRIDDKIITEDKNFVYLQSNGDKIDKKTLAAVVYADGHHVLYAAPEKAAILLWENKPPVDQPATVAANAPVQAAVKKGPAASLTMSTETASPPEPKKETPPIASTTTAAPAKKPAIDTVQPHALTFEEVAGNVSKAEFEKKALQKTNQLNIYLKVICDKSANYEEINKAIDQSIGLFVDENAMIETSSVNRNDVKRYKIRNYLSHIKLVNYDRIEIEWTNVQYVSDVKQGPDGNYYGIVSFEQVFRGYRDGKLMYQDVTRKNATVVLKTYEKNIEGNTKNVWDVLLSDIGVISTKSL